MRYLTLAAFAGAVALSVGCGSKAPEECVKMLECDAAYATALEVSASFDGLDDANYGDGGTCYKGDKDACIAACNSAVDGYKTGLQAAVDAGTIEAIPSECE